MGRADLVEPYALRVARRNVKESLQMHGEEVVALHMFHTDPDQGVQPRCPVCYDDVYASKDRWDCTECFGTTFENGVKLFGRSWALFTTDSLTENTKKDGEYQPFSHSIQLETRPQLIRNDYILRVARWSRDHRPIALHGAYKVGVIAPESLRTGNQLGQDGNDYVAQRGKADLLPTSHPIYHAMGKVVSPDFPVARMDGLVR